MVVLFNRLAPRLCTLLPLYCTPIHRGTLTRLARDVFIFDRRGILESPRDADALHWWPPVIADQLSYEPFAFHPTLSKMLKPMIERIIPFQILDAAIDQSHCNGNHRDSLSVELRGGNGFTRDCIDAASHPRWMLISLRYQL